MRILVVALLLLQAPDWLPRVRRPLPELVADVVTVAPRQYTVELENEQVRVLRARLDADASVPLHYAPAGLLVALTDVHLTLTRPDASQQSFELAPGQVQWMPRGVYSVRNLNSRPVEFLFVATR